MVSEEVRTKKLVVVDRDGYKRAVLTTHEDGSPLFSLIDEDGTQRLGLGVGPAGGGLTLDGKDGHPRAMLHAFNDSAALGSSGDAVGDC